MYYKIESERNCQRADNGAYNPIHRFYLLKALQAPAELFCSFICVSILFSPGMIRLSTTPRTTVVKATGQKDRLNIQAQDGQAKVHQKLTAVEAMRFIQAAVLFTFHTMPMK